MELDKVSEIVSEKRLRLEDLVSPQDGSNVLHIAASMDHPMLIVDLFMGYNCATLMHQANKKGDLPIHSAVKAGKLQSFKALFQWSNALEELICERPHLEGNTVLHLALLNNQREIADSLYERCPQAAYCLNKDNVSPLFLAIKNWGECDLVNQMIQGLEGNAQIQNNLRDSKSIVHLAIHTRKIAILNSIFKEAPGLVDSFDTEGRNPLSYAVQMGYIEVAKSPLFEFPRLNFQGDKNEDGSYPIHHAVKKGEVETIKLLQCANICLLNNKSQNILHVAAEAGQWNAVNYLLELQEFKDLLNTGDDDGNTPLHLAIKDFNGAIVESLVLKLHIDINSTNKELFTARDLYELNLQYQFRG